MNKCSICHSDTVSRNIIYTQLYEGNLVVVENVPAEVCSVCGEEYFSPEIADKIQKAIESKNFFKTIEVPVFQLT